MSNQDFNVADVIPLSNEMLMLSQQQKAFASKQPSIGPIETQMRAKLDRLTGTKYVDTFDWGIYDGIAKRFGLEQPRGGVVFKTNFKLVNYHSSCSKCHYAFEIDSYGRGCIHNCTYCYAKDQLSTHGFWNRPMPFPIDLAEVRKVMYTVFETDKPSRWRSTLGKRVPVRIGSMSDSFMWMDQKYGVTKELLKIFSFYDYPHVIFTRSDLVAHDEYLKIMRPHLVSIQMSMSGDNDVVIKSMEPGAPSSSRRLAALKKAADAGFWTTIRVNPLFPEFPDGYYTDSSSVLARFGTESKLPKLDLITPEFYSKIADAKVPSVLAGFVRLSPTAVKNMSIATGVDLRSFFKPDLWDQGKDKRYSDAEIGWYYDDIKRKLSKHNIRFSTCYIGNGMKDYFQYQSLWSNKSDCCDVVGNVSGFETTSQSIPWSERERFAPDAQTVASTRAEEFGFGVR